jgi:hypothetical protein
MCVDFFPLMSQPISSLQRSDGHRGEALLRYYTAEWDKYTTGASYANRVFVCLNRNWVKHERDEGRKGVYPTYTVCPFFHILTPIIIDTHRLL